MTWSIQLTLWSLPPLLAGLLVLRDGAFLWPRHRETGTLALLAMVGSAGAWALVDFVCLTSPSLSVKLLTTRIEYLPASAAAVAWAGFGLAYAGRPAGLKRWPMLLLSGVALATALVALAPKATVFFIQDPVLLPLNGVVGLQVDHGIGHWVSQAVRFVGVSAGTLTITRTLARTPGERRRVFYAFAAAALALAPALVQHLGARGADWADLSSTGFALGGAVLVWGLMRPRILHLGPVNRDLVLNELDDPIVVMDARGHLVDVNRAGREELGLEPYGDVPLGFGTLWVKGPGGEGAPPTLVEFHNRKGEAHTYEVTLTRLDDDDAPGRSALLLRDVTTRERIQRELERAYADLERLAHTDPLTELANRRHFMETLMREVYRADRYRHPLSIVILDLDRFKGVNDTHGHAAGDDVLRDAATALRSVCRDVDMAARLGGEEMALLLPETDLPGARIVAERVRECIAATPHRSPVGDPFRVTASFGVATAKPGTTSETLLQAADEALYRAKRAGRNQVMLAH
ncbi:MAG: diguanylate cyclase [Longimicrobiales bacterium]|nr:diguanylate cyclase [Longimicrobiales bacterium]